MTASWSTRSTSQRHRMTVRYLAAAASALTALLYFGIGLGVLKVVDEGAAGGPGLLEFGASAGAAFALGAVLLVVVDHRGLWLLGALLQVIVLIMYLAVSPQRTPPFEAWGILIKILQAALLAGLAYLVVHVPERRLPRTWQPSK